MSGDRRGLFITAIALSAFLLFSIELLAGRLVLPVFGGTPGVWATTLSFFTTILFLGYVYAHVVATRLSPRTGGRVHLAVAVSALAAVLLSPTAVSTLRNPDLAEPLNVLLAQAVLVGAPAFLLASTTPLLSAWYGRSGKDPWWLYAASNAASLAGLLAYPLLIEPRIGLGVQRTLVAVGLGAFVVLVCLIVMRGGASESRATEPVEAAPPLDIGRQATWLIAAFVPAGLLAATTNFIATDLVSAPLLWVGPLAMYLLSFVIAFSERGRRVFRHIDWLVPLAALGLFLPWTQDTTWPVWTLLMTELGTLLVIATSIHMRLALDRPDERQLTRFYLVLSAGGMLATAFVALLAPVIYSTVYEYPILIIGSLVVLMLLPRPPRRRLIDFVAVATAAGLLFLGVTDTSDTLLQRRSFFGVLELYTDGVVITEYSGTTLHGAQFLDDRRSEPTTYYVRAGPLGDAFADLWARTTTANVGTIGLGIGTTMAYARPGDAFTFFEIDQAVVDIARDPSYFTYLTDAPLEPRIVLGDARLSMTDEAPESFDLLILDAFSSDAVPAHLLTREAMETYLRTLHPGGVVLFHLSNRYYNLGLAVVATAHSMDLAAVGRLYLPSSEEMTGSGAEGSAWVVVGRAADVERFRAIGWIEGGGGPILTDDYSDLLRVLSIGLN